MEISYISMETPYTFERPPIRWVDYLSQTEWWRKFEEVCIQKWMWHILENNQIQQVQKNVDGITIEIVGL